MPIRRPLLAALLALGTLPRIAVGYSVGISGYSGRSRVNCNQCHSGGQPPGVTLDGPATMDPGKTGTYTLTVQSADPDAQTAAGIDIAADGGTLSIVSGQQEQLVPLVHEITHTSPKSNDINGITAWQFKWKAPAPAGNYTLYASGNSVNRNTTTSGDAAASTLFFVAVGAVTPLPTLTPTAAPASDTPTATPTDTPASTATATQSTTATPTASVSATPSPSPTATDVRSPTPAPSATDTPTVTETPTDTPTPTLTATTTDTVPPTPTPVPGDANCDGVVTAADLPARVEVPDALDPGPCGADANQNGEADGEDLFATLSAIFGD